MNILKAILFGIVEGVTEWLPVSSTGHMILLNQFVKLDVSKEFFNMFLVVIQFGAILAVIIMFWGLIWPLGRSKESGKICWKRPVLRLWLRTIVSCLPAAVVGLLLDDWIDEHLYNWVVVSLALIIVGIAFILVENKNSNREPSVARLGEFSNKDAFIIGLFQTVAAVFPGTSRSGSTILGGIAIGVSRKTAAQFTFVLAIPVMAGASLFKMVKYVHNGGTFTMNETAILLTGSIVAFVVSIFIIKFLMGYIRKHNFKPFAWYRIVLGIVVIAYFAIAGK